MFPPVPTTRPCPNCNSEMTVTMITPIKLPTGTPFDNGAQRMTEGRLASERIRAACPKNVQHFDLLQRG